MADITNLNKFLTDVADAIRTKNETTDPIPAEEFDAEILKIETGVMPDSEYEQCLLLSNNILGKEITYTQNPVTDGLLMNLLSNKNTGTGFLPGVTTWVDTYNATSNSFPNITWDSTEKSAVFGGSTMCTTNIDCSTLAKGYTMVFRFNGATDIGHEGCLFGNDGWKADRGFRGMYYNRGGYWWWTHRTTDGVTIPISKLPKGSYHTVIVTFDGTSAYTSFYIENEFYTGATMAMKTASAPMRIGKEWANYKGRLSHCIIYNRVLTDLERSLVYDYVTKTIG
jgi:hypothetical protein